MLVERGQTRVDNALDLPVRLSQEPLQRNRRIQSAVAERLENAAHHAPELVHVVASRRVFEGSGDFGQGIQMPRRAAAALDPAEERKLKLGS